MRPLRSLLFVPADDPKKLAKALTRGADALILDLEDAVAEPAKADARNAAAAFVAEHAPRSDRPRLIIRINGFAHPAVAGDIAAAVAAGADAVMLPKATGLADVERLHGGLAVAEAESGRADGAVGIIPLASEGAAAVLALPSLGTGHPRMIALAWSGEDLALDINAAASRRPDGSLPDVMRLARSLALLAAGAAQVPAIDAVFGGIADAAGLAAIVAAAVEDGFAGKLAIHPGQVGPINDGFTPSPEALARARAVLAAFAASEGRGAVALDGEMLDHPHLLRAQRVLRQAGETPE